MSSQPLIRLLLGLCLVLTQACVYMPSRRLLQLQELPDGPIPKKCLLLGQVQGDSHYAFLAAGQEIARNRAKLRALELGATHIYWTEIVTELQPYALGRAYLCRP